MKFNEKLTTAGTVTVSPSSTELYFLSFASPPSRIGFISSASTGDNSASARQLKKSYFLSIFPELNSHPVRADTARSEIMDTTIAKVLKGNNCPSASVHNG